MKKTAVLFFILLVSLSFYGSLTNPVVSKHTVPKAQSSDLGFFTQPSVGQFEAYGTPSAIVSVSEKFYPFNNYTAGGHLYLSGGAQYAAVNVYYGTTQSSKWFSYSGPFTLSGGSQ